MNRWLASLITFVFPAKCRRCETPMGVGKVHYLCDDCWEQIELLKPPWCQICGLPCWSAVCADCREHPPLFGKLRAIAFYEPTLREAVHLMKYEKKQVMSRHLIQLLQAHLPQDLASTDYDFLLPIPLHTNRCGSEDLTKRNKLPKASLRFGGCQSEMIFSFVLGTRSPLSSLESHEERMKNIAGAFESSVAGLYSGSEDSTD